MWTPLLLAVPLLVAAVGALVFEAALGGAHASVTSAGRLAPHASAGCG